MRYSTIVEKDDKTLVEIINALEQFEEDRFIAGIQARHYTKYDIEQALDMVVSYQSKMNIEARSLVKFSETFIQQFATDNNKCFESAQRYFNRIRSTLCAIKKVFQKTTPRSMVQLPEGSQNPTVFERSPLSYGACVIDLWGLSSYDDCVQSLYQQLETLLTTATTILGLCHEMICNEENIRKDASQLKKIYRESCEQLMGSVREFAGFLGTVEQLPETELNKRRQMARSMDDFLKKEYHNVPKKEFKKYVFLEAMRKGRNDGLTEEEAYLFCDNHEKVKQVRWAIKHFDEMDVEGQQGKLDSTLIVYFLKWCDVGQAKEKRLYKYFCSNYCGRFQPLVWSAVSKERKEQHERGITDRGAASAFKEMIEKVPKEAEVL
jgi:hypothetical protein